MDLIRPAAKSDIFDCSVNVVGEVKDLSLPRIHEWHSWHAKVNMHGGGYVTDTGKQTDDCFVITLGLPVGGAVSVIMLQLLLYCNIIRTSLYQAAEIIKTTARNITAGTHYKQVGVQLQRTLTTWHCPHLLLRAVLRRGAGHAAIDRYLLPATPTAANQQNRHTLLQRANGTGRRTDPVPLYIAPLPHTMRMTYCI